MTPIGPRWVTLATMTTGAPFETATAMVPASAKPNRSPPEDTTCTVLPDPLPGLTVRSSPSAA